jgi:SAM-dependent methyltransferase
MWGRKAADLYRPEYARKYRAHDDELATVEAYTRFCSWIAEVCDRFSGDIDVLDLGCGTGRYFRAIRHARTIVGIDASAAMLAEARTPLAADEISAGSIELVEGDFVTHDFSASRFDLVYSIGVLAEHTPLDVRLVRSVFRWLRPGGRFAFTTVHPDSPSVPRTLRRSAGRLLLPLTVGAVRRHLRERLTAAGLYGDEPLIHELLDGRFEIESLARVVSEAHLHCLCVARKGDR